MMEFFGQHDNADTDGFSDFEKAMEDTVVLLAARESKKRAERINNDSGELPEATIQTDLLELNHMVYHVLNQSVTVSGNIQVVYDGDESASQFVSEVSGRFDGFADSYRNNSVNYDYLMTVLIDEEGNFRTGDIDSDTTEFFKPVIIQARPSEVFLKFDTIHPVRARAILETSFSSTLHDLDSRIINPDSEGDMDPEAAILNLQGFTVKKDAEELTHETEEYMESINTYVNAMITIDKEVPYLLSLDGAYIDIYDGSVMLSDANEEMLMKVDRMVMFNLQNPIEGLSDDYTFCVVGKVYKDDPDIKAKEILIPLSSIGKIRSVRRLISEYDFSQSEE
jgi:hypothetical protein